jgi:hypothetical protein
VTPAAHSAAATRGRLDLEPLDDRHSEALCLARMMPRALRALRGTLRRGHSRVLGRSAPP